MSAPTASNPSMSVHEPSSNPSSVPRAPGTIPSDSSNATGSSKAISPPLLSPSSQSTSSRPQPSKSASTSRSATSPPTTTTATASAAGGAQPRVTMDLHPNLPSRATQIHIDEARAALVASMSNMLDSELQSRASLLHSNAAALTRQEKDVIRGTEALRKENDKLEKLARDTERKIKELGNVQNWAEVLERDFLVLEETMRLVREGSGSNNDSCSECSGSSWSGSYSADDSRAGSRRGSVTGDADGDANGNANGDAKKTDGCGINGDTTTDSATRSNEATKRDYVNVTVNRSVAASISEAMATDLHEPLESLSLNTVPPESQESSIKGKERAVEDNRVEITNTSGTSGSREPSQSSDTARTELVGEVTAVNHGLNPSTATG
ncbi:hypothetical protein F4804DRAFT_297811 [Jackrogersella minutella]|nr:hypothetical protein F4804DRAFT_297811 [Jackrogersella minutella]